MKQTFIVTLDDQTRDEPIHFSEIAAAVKAYLEKHVPENFRHRNIVASRLE